MASLIAKVGVMRCGWVSGLVAWVKWVGFIRASFGYQGAAECNMSPGLGGSGSIRLEGAIYGSYC